MIHEHRSYALQMPQGESKLFSVYVPTNHVYVGDIFLLTSDDIIKPNLSVREGLEIVVSVGTAPTAFPLHKPSVGSPRCNTKQASRLLIIIMHGTRTES